MNDLSIKSIYIQTIDTISKITVHLIVNLIHISGFLDIVFLFL